MQCGMTNWSTALSCKRCGTASNNSAVMAGAPAGRSAVRYPLGHFPNEAALGETIKSCIHCGKEMGLKRWDSWNGFLVQCPHCGGLHGKHWKIKHIATASLFFSAVSFLFTMRPQNAAIAASLFVIFALIGSYLSNSGKIPDLLEVAGAAVLFLGPMMINAIVLIKHESDLDNSAPSTQSLHS